MPAPVVQNLDDILASLSPAYSGQEQVIGQQQAALPGKYDAERQALGAEKTNTFRDINTGANSKGLAFSGIPEAEQARYLGEKYLPGLTNLTTQQNTEGLTLSGQLASLESDKRLRALDTQNTQQKALSDWQNAQELQQEQEAFDKWKTANDQAFQLKLEGMKESYGASQAAASPLTQTQTAAAIRSELERVKGSDGHVAPSDLATAYNDWVGSGYDPNSFWKNFQGYWNPKQGNYKQQFNAAR